MGQPAVKINDQVIGPCQPGLHQIIGPGGSPTPSPAPLPFMGPLTLQLTTTVFVEGGPAAVEGSSGINTSPHVGLHASDQHFAPNLQEAKVTVGSSTVFFDGKAAAYSGCQTSICFQMPGQLTGTATTVAVGP